MLEVILCIILLPAAIMAGTFTVALGAGAILYLAKKNKPKGSEKN